MPAGPSELGFVYFVAAKYLGYTGFCRAVVQPQCIDEESNAARIPSAWKAGAVRTGIGIAIGVVVGLGFWKIPYFARHEFFDNGMFFLLLVPVRIFEWWLLLRWIYGECRLTRQQYIFLIFVGIVASFVLDGLGVLTAFVLPGGAWVC